MSRNYDNEEGCLNIFKIGIVIAVFFGVFIGSYLQAKETLYKKYY